MPEYITLAETADLLDCTKRTVRNRIKRHGWRNHLESVEGEGFRTQVRMVALADVMETHAAEQTETLPAAVSQGGKLPEKDSERFTECMETLANALHAHTAELREQRNHRRRENILTLAVGIGFVLLLAVLIWLGPALLAHPA